MYGIDLESLITNRVRLGQIEEYKWLNDLKGKNFLRGII